VLKSQEMLTTKKITYKNSNIFVVQRLGLDSLTSFTDSNVSKSCNTALQNVK